MAVRLRLLTLAAALACIGCLRYWLPAFLPATSQSCTIQGDCFVDGGWMRPDGSYIVTPKCTTLEDGSQTYGPLVDGESIACPDPRCPWDCVGHGETYDAGVTIEIELDTPRQ
jgi:hypothetical protein